MKTVELREKRKKRREQIEVVFFIWLAEKL